MFFPGSGLCTEKLYQFELYKEQKVIDAGNSGQFFKHVNKKLGRAQGIGILINEQGEAVLNDEDKANLLSQFFSSVNLTDNNIVPDFPSRVSKNTRLESVQFRPQTVRKLSQKIKPKLSQGPDGYPRTF